MYLGHRPQEIGSKRHETYGCVELRLFPVCHDSTCLYDRFKLSGLI